MFDILGVPAQANQSTNKTISGAVVLSAKSFVHVTLSAIEGHVQSTKGYRFYHSRNLQPK